MKIRVKDHVKLQPDKMAKVALATTPRAQLDVYCLAPGQTQKTHVHADQDKICYVVEGRGRFTVDGGDETLEPGEAIVARAGTSHGITNASDAPLVVLVVVTPPPPHA
ncbi:MAG: cupin domain-containing protein [Candidatus Rokubacteria bacterium]|nr:cupin domain-containing protein [Candidatus Rokubacteria bacterium]